MATVTQIVTRAHRKIGVVAHDEPLTADQLANGVDALNSMIHAWRIEGIDFGWADQAAADTFSLDDQYHEAAVYLLGARLAPDFGVPVAYNSEPFLAALRSYNVEPQSAVAMPSAILNMPSQYLRGSWSRGKGN